MLVRVAGLVVALSIVGAANAAAPPSPCKLVTTAQVKAAFGGTVGAGKVDNTVPGAPTCHFAVKHSNLGISGDAIVFITPGQSAATFKLAKKYVPGAVTVTGVGTAAFYNPHTTSVELLKGNVVASAQGVFYNADGPQANAAKIKADVVALAKAVAKNL
jgi:type IV secretory pathway protease TraF